MKIYLILMINQLFLITFRFTLIDCIVYNEYIVEIHSKNMLALWIFTTGRRLQFKADSMVLEVIMKTTVPSKCKHVMWCAWSGTLPTWTSMKKKGMSVSPQCVICLQMDETVTHVLWACPMQGRPRELGCPNPVLILIVLLII